MVTSTFDIFIGGPMGDPTDDGAGVPLNQHIGNIAEAIRRIAPKMQRRHRGWKIVVQHPDVPRVGGIPNEVFSMIDDAELGLFDLSNRAPGAGGPPNYSPTVMYELTLMHALGKPVLPVLLDTPKRDLPFNLAQDYALFVSNFRVETLMEQLRPRIDSALSGKIYAPGNWSNPITHYYRIPLVDASATTGLATTYFHNFVRHVIKQTDSIFTQRDGMARLVVLRPAKLDDAVGRRKPLERRIGELGIAVEEVEDKDGKLPEVPGQPRGKMILFKAGRYIFDHPAPLVAMKSSPMFQLLADRMVGATGTRKVKFDSYLDRRQAEMIAAFFRILDRLVFKGTEVDSNLLIVATEDEFLDLLRADLPAPQLAGG